MMEYHRKTCSQRIANDNGKHSQYFISLSLQKVRGPPTTYLHTPTWCSSLWLFFLTLPNIKDNSFWHTVRLVFSTYLSINIYAKYLSTDRGMRDVKCLRVIFLCGFQFYAHKESYYF